MSERVSRPGHPDSLTDPRFAPNVINISSKKPDLPPELIEVIIDFVAFSPNPKPPLRAFALVSRAFRAKCQKHLFHTIDFGDQVISNGGPEEYYQRFLRFLLGHAALVSTQHASSNQPPVHSGSDPEPISDVRTYVKDLRIIDMYSWDRGRGRGYTTVPQAQEGWRWFAQLQTLPQLFSFLPNLTSFSLTFNSPSTLRIARPTWDALKPSVRQAISELIGRPRNEATGAKEGGGAHDQTSRRTQLHSFSIAGITAIPPNLLVSLCRAVSTLVLDNVDLEVTPGTVFNFVSALTTSGPGHGLPPIAISKDDNATPHLIQGTSRRLRVTSLTLRAPSTSLVSCMTKVFLAPSPSPSSSSSAYPSYTYSPQWDPLESTCRHASLSIL